MLSLHPPPHGERLGAALEALLGCRRNGGREPLSEAPGRPASGTVLVSRGTITHELAGVRPCGVRVRAASTLFRIPYWSRGRSPWSAPGDGRRVPGAAEVVRGRGDVSHGTDRRSGLWQPPWTSGASTVLGSLTRLEGGTSVGSCTRRSCLSDSNAAQILSASDRSIGRAGAPPTALTSSRARLTFPASTATRPQFSELVPRVTEPVSDVVPGARVAEAVRPQTGRNRGPQLGQEN